MRPLALTLLLAFVSLPCLARAQGAPVVVELYTSQGCSSCPPADAFLTELAQRPDVIALALHVDYWDYLGWKDDFGRPEHTARQRAYAKRAKSRSIYTPQIVVQGQDRLIGHDVDAVTERITALRAEPLEVSLQVERDGDALRIRLAPNGDAVGGPADLYVVSYNPSATVSIEAGENAGQSITYSNIVTNWVPIGQWDGRSEAELRYEGAGPSPLAVIVQRTRLGPILAGARLP